jgi:hypothetical protein
MGGKMYDCYKDLVYTGKYNPTYRELIMWVDMSLHLETLSWLIMWMVRFWYKKCESKECLASNQENISKWSDMSTHMINQNNVSKWSDMSTHIQKNGTG